MYAYRKQRRATDRSRGKVCTAEDLRNAAELAKILGSRVQRSDILNFERALKALAAYNRIMIVLLLSRRDMCVCEISAALSLPQPSISHDLRILEREGIVERCRSGKWVFYHLVKSSLTLLIARSLGREALKETRE